MAGTKNDVLVGKNADFTQSGAPNAQSSETNGLVTDGQLWIGSTALNAGNTHINVGNITSTSLTVGYSSPDITIELPGGGSGIEQITVDNSTVPGTNPVLPLAGNVTITGGQVANASLANVIQTHSLAANSFAVTIQRSAAVAAADSTKNGVSHFDSDIFTVDANGFVSTSGGTLVQEVLGGPGVTITGTATNPIVNSVVYTDQGGSTSVISDSGSFATAAITLTLPATPAQGELCEFVTTSAAVLIVDAPGTQLIRSANAITSAGGTITSSGLAGDSLSLRYRTSDTTWYATSVIGVWVTA
jgi:hypothetical protein